MGEQAAVQASEQVSGQQCKQWRRQKCGQRCRQQCGQRCQAGGQECRVAAVQAGRQQCRQAAAVQAGSHLLETSSSTATFPGCLARGFPADEDLAGMTTLCSPSIVTRGPGWVGEEVKGVWGGSSGLVVCWSY